MTEQQAGLGGIQTWGKGIGAGYRSCSSLVDALHEKTNLKVFVVVIPKEGLKGWE